MELESAATGEPPKSQRKALKGRRTNMEIAGAKNNNTIVQSFHQQLSNKAAKTTETPEIKTGTKRHPTSGEKPSNKKQDEKSTPEAKKQPENPNSEEADLEAVLSDSFFVLCETQTKSLHGGRIPE